MTAKDYLALPYKIVLQKMDDGDGLYYFATVEEFPGCMSHGDTPENAMLNISDAMALWVQAQLDYGLPVPQPLAEAEGQYSGRFVVRVPKTLHAALAKKAKSEGVSLNQYALFKLAAG
ncbi:MAG: type II toxin-antitoxin system HicB family antitoxin [Oscillospiraceae bacterium]|jgi:predicted RNase H-like HicB family nuclease|nr:type II toxin-antitoxin system HicB family antitoxin [Oscillospiraceae bacterium]